MSSNLSPEFSSIQYWLDRHNKYGPDPTGVGNVSFSPEENAEIYRKTDLYLRSILKELRFPKNSYALDLGCGIGMLAKAFIETGYHYTGVDCSETALTIARRENPLGQFVTGNIANKHFEIGFEIIIERTVFVHLIEDSYWHSVLERVKESLVPRGVFILMDYIPKTPSDTTTSVKHVRQRTVSDYENAFRRLGLCFDTTLRSSVGQTVNLSENTHFVRHAS